MTERGYHVSYYMYSGKIALYSMKIDMVEIIFSFPMLFDSRKYCETNNNTGKV